MKTVSPFSYAALLIAVRIFALSMYVPAANENPAITVLTSAAVSLAKLIILLPLCVFFSRKKSLPSTADSNLRSHRFVCKSLAIFTLLCSSIFVLMINDAFSTVVESVYPDRFTKIGIIAVLPIIAAYISSMGINGLTRTAAVTSVCFIAVFAVILLGMHSDMHTENINFYSENLRSEILATLKNLTAFLGDIFLFFTLLPYLKKSPVKAAGIYLTTDVLVTAVFLLTSSAVMGGFQSSSGFAFFTLAYFTHGSFIDRADGIFLSASAACAFITSAALFTVLKDSLKYLFPKTENGGILLVSSATLTLSGLSLANYGLHIGEKTDILSAVSVFVLAASAVIFAISARRKGANAKK
jgi:hypothetical protein